MVKTVVRNPPSCSRTRRKRARMPPEHTPRQTAQGLGRTRARRVVCGTCFAARRRTRTDSDGLGRTRTLPASGDRSSRGRLRTDRADARADDYVCVFLCVRALVCARACVRACVRACACARACARLFVRVGALGRACSCARMRACARRNGRRNRVQANKRRLRRALPSLLGIR